MRTAVLMLAVSAPVAALVSAAAGADGPRHVVPRSAQIETGPPGGAQAATRSKIPVGGHPANIVPFTPSPDLRRPTRRDALPRFWADGRSCSTGCRPAARTGWPLRPFRRQHPIRAGINELRTGSMHSGIDIQARNGQAVYAMQGGRAKVVRQGFDTYVHVGRFVYYHVRPWVTEGQIVSAYSTVLGQVIAPGGHVHVTDLRGKTELNPLRPGGRVVGPWRDREPPVIGTPSFRPGGRVTVQVYDPQTYVRRTSYSTPVLAPAALAYRVSRARGGRAVTGLRWALRGTHVYPYSLRHRIYAPGARGGGFVCFAYHPRCTPNWHYRLAGGLAPRLRLRSGIYRLHVYAWDWAGNATARDERFVVVP
jgi:murein DD-endopeptidase MepM/ murein hydrolase activator NlpD